MLFALRTTFDDLRSMSSVKWNKVVAVFVTKSFRKLDASKHPMQEARPMTIKTNTHLQRNLPVTIPTAAGLAGS